MHGCFLIAHCQACLAMSPTIVVEHPPSRAELDCQAIIAHEKAVQEGHARMRKLFDEMRKGHQIDWEIVRGVPGVRLEPISWKELEEIIHDGSPRALGRLGRDPLSLRDYWLFRRAKLQDYGSMEDYLLHTIFDLPTREEEDQKLHAIVPPDFKSTVKVVWRLNDFPYDLEDGIEHHNLWSSHLLTADSTEEEIRKHCPEQEFIWFINPEALMSVPTIWHAQVFSRKMGPESK